MEKGWRNIRSRTQAKHSREFTQAKYLICQAHMISNYLANSQFDQFNFETPISGFTCSLCYVWPYQDAFLKTNQL